MNILVGQDQRTLCGRLATRHIDIFSPNEATCRECKRRWELDQPATTQDMSLYNSLHARPSSMKKSHPPVTKPVHPTISEQSESEKRAVEMNAVAIWAAESGIRMSDGNRLSSGWESLSEVIRDQYREMARTSIGARQKDQ